MIQNSPEPDDLPEAHVFIVTYGRSGSTLTQSLLNTLPGYQIRGENGNLAWYLARACDLVRHHEMFALRRRDAALPPERRSDYLAPLVGQPHDPWAGAELVDPDALRRGLMDVFSREVLRPGPGCRVSGFKEIRFHEDPDFFATYLDVLRDSFPRTRFLFQTRDRDAVARSGWWAQQPRHEVIAQLRGAEHLFPDYAATHPAECFTIRYERYAEGADYVAEILDFLGERMERDAIEAALARSLSH